MLFAMFGFKVVAAANLACFPPSPAAAAAAATPVIRMATTVNPMLLAWQEALPHWDKPANCTSVTAQVDRMNADAIVVGAVIDGHELAMYVDGAMYTSKVARQCTVAKIQHAFETEALHHSGAAAPTDYANCTMPLTAAGTASQ
jgi:hypothetical protein